MGLCLVIQQHILNWQDISCLKGDLDKALGQVNESLSTNAEITVPFVLKLQFREDLGDFEGAANNT